MLPIHTVLHPTDFSDRSEFAFQMACSLARDYGARLLIVHVVEPAVPIYGNGLVVAPVRTFEEPLQARLEQLRPPDARIRVEHRLLEGDAAREILAFAEKAGCDFIVMGTHGRSGLGRVLMGSVAEQVVRRASCPVLTVRTPLPGARPTGESAVAAGTASAPAQ